MIACVEHYQKRWHDDVLKIVKEFYRYVDSHWLGRLDDDWLNGIIKAGEEQKWHKNSFLLIVDGKLKGICYGIVYPCTANGDPMFQEICLWVEPEARRFGLYFLRTIEKELRKQGIKLMIMTVLGNQDEEKLKKLYTRLGYEKLETHYVRNFSWDGQNGKT